MQTPVLINEPLLTPDMKRTRSGATQLFRKDYKDRQFASEENADVVLRPPERHLFADLIDGQWYWVNGCAECNGRPRDWMTYIECEKHDVCRTCSTHRTQLSEAPWGGKNGWQCKPCAQREHEAEKAEALAAMPEDHDEIDYKHEDKARCPYCDLEIEVEGEDLDEMISREQTLECSRCDNEFTIEAEISVTYSTSRIEQS